MGRHQGRWIGAGGRAAVIFGAAATLWLGSAACSSSDSGGAGDAGSDAGTGSTVAVQDFAFTPADLTVAPGTTVTWTFEDSAVHDVVANDSSFSSPQLRDGETYQFTFTEPGSVEYICSIHPYMKGAVTVQ